MNKRKILASINKLANELDLNSFHKEADQLTKIMTKIASEFSDEEFEELLRKSRDRDDEDEVDPKILEIYKKALRERLEGISGPVKDPVEEAAEKGMRDFPGSEYDRAYDTALQDLQAAFEVHDNSPSYDLLAHKAKQVARQYMKMENRTPKDLVTLVDDAIYDMEM